MESGTNFISVLDELNLNYIVAIRSNHSVELLQDKEFNI